MGRWGIKNLFWFNDALSLKILWRGLFGQGLWKDILHTKYLKIIPIVQWIRSNNREVSCASNFWLCFMKVYLCLGVGLSWQVGNGKMVHLGVDSFVGGEDFYTLSHALIYDMTKRHCSRLAHAKNMMESSFSYWYSIEESSFNSNVVDEWRHFVEGLNHLGI